MPTSAAPYLYALGFVAGTALIHLLGVLLGWIVSRIPFRTTVFRVSGATLAILGIYFLVQSVSASGAAGAPALTSAISN
jgi:urease accessory protein